MKRIILGLFLTIVMTDAARADVFGAFSSLGKDKYVNFCAGTLISHGSYPLFRKVLKNKDDAWLYSLGLAVLAGVGKELNDKKTTGFSATDLFAGFAGGATILVVKF